MIDLALMNSDAFGWRVAELIQDGGTFIDRIMAEAHALGRRPSREEAVAAAGCSYEELIAVFAIMEARAPGAPAETAQLLGLDLEVTASVHNHAGFNKTSWRFHAKPGRPGAMLG